jgi:hypothetical protein
MLVSSMIVFSVPGDLVANALDMLPFGQPCLDHTNYSIKAE